ncbi:MAG: TonB-dependent receptor [Xanthomonadales bacterium]|nr:TonB-dependent receptor [Xanthomonadales bacterium]
MKRSELFNGSFFSGGVFVGFSLLLLAAGAPAQAQVLEEVMVTAQKREQGIQDVSIAITAWTGEQIRQLGFESSGEVARMTPGVSIAGTSAGQDAQFSIRGVTQTDFTDFVEPPNAVYVDEGYIPTTQGQRFGLFDIDRVEILKGPQGTLFGRNATGGLVHYVTRKPTEAFEAYSDVLYGSHDQVRLEAAVSGPLTANVNGRLSAMFNRHDEIATNHYPAQNTINPLTGVPFNGSRSGADDMWNDNQWAIRGQLLWKINDRAELLLSGFAAHEEVSVGYYQQGAVTAVINADGNHVNTIRAENDPQGCEAISAETGGCLPIDFVDGNFGNTVRPVVGGDLFGYREFGGIDDLDVSVDHALDDGNEYDIYGGTANLAWELEGMTVTAISHFMHFEKEQTLDADVSPTPQSMVNNNNDTDSFSQELRINGGGDGYNWVAGLYYLYMDNNNVIALDFPEDSPITLLLPFGPFDSASLVNLQTDSYSAFGQIDWDLSERLTLVAGIRVIQEEKEFRYDNLFFPNVNDHLVDTDQTPLDSFGFTYPSFQDDTSDTLWAGRVALEYRPDDDWLWYLSINRGVKAGSFNGKLNDFTPALNEEDIPYDEEVLLAYETGFKSTLLDGLARLNGSFYYYDYDDYQAFVFSGSSGFVRNADAEYFGAELEFIVKPTPQLDLILNGSWIDATVFDLEVADSVFRDVTPAHTPEFQFAMLARYTLPQLVFDGNLAAQVDVTYTDDRFHNIRNFDAQRMDSFWMTNVRLSWTSADSRWEGTLFVNNLTDERYVHTGFDLATLCGCAEESYGKPRWYGAKLRFNWF